MTDERERLLEKMAVAMRDAGAFLPGNSRGLAMDAAKAALSAIEQAGGYAPEGYWIAPDEPSDEHQRAIVASIERLDNPVIDDLRAANRVNQNGVMAIGAAMFLPMWRAMRNAAKEQ